MAQLAGPVLRCKMRVASVQRLIGTDGEATQENVTLSAVSGNTDENKEWSKWTPNATLQITINNPEAYGKLSSGHEFYCDFTAAE